RGLRAELNAVRGRDLFGQLHQLSVGSYIKKQMLAARRRLTKCSLSVWNGIAEVNAVVLCDDEIVRAHQRLSLELVGQHLARRGENPNFRVSRLRPNETTLVIIRKTHSAIGIFEIRRNVVVLVDFAQFTGILLGEP